MLGLPCSPLSHLSLSCCARPAAAFIEMEYRTGFLSQRFRPAQTADHGHLQQIIAGQSGVGGGAPEKIAEFIVGRLQIAFVLDRLPLDIFLGDEPALLLEAIELCLRLVAAPDLDQPFGEIYRIVNAAIHAHTAKRIVDMRGIADQENAVLTESFGDA